MKFWSSNHVFEHSWDTVVHAAWRKYPNALKPEVTALDVVDRKFGDDGVLRSTRIMRTEWHIPGWVTRFIGLENPSYSYEYSEVRLDDCHMMLKSKNLNCTKFVDIDETLIYKPHPDDSSKTLMEQSAVITMKGIPLVDYCENLMASTINKNADKGRLAMEMVIDRIKQEYEDFAQKISSTGNLNNSGQLLVEI